MWVVLPSVDPIAEKSDQITGVLLEIYKENSELDKWFIFFPIPFSMNFYDSMVLTAAVNLIHLLFCFLTQALDYQYCIYANYLLDSYVQQVKQSICKVV